MADSSKAHRPVRSHPAVRPGRTAVQDCLLRRSPARVRGTPRDLRLAPGPVRTAKLRLTRAEPKKHALREIAIPCGIRPEAGGGAGATSKVSALAGKKGSSGGYQGHVTSAVPVVPEFVTVSRQQAPSGLLKITPCPASVIAISPPLTVSLAPGTAVPTPTFPPLAPRTRIFRGIQRQHPALQNLCPLAQGLRARREDLWGHGGTPCRSRPFFGDADPSR